MYVFVCVRERERWSHPVSHVNVSVRAEHKAVCFKP